MLEDPRNITFCIHLMFCAKNVERMGDHATNIAETGSLCDRWPAHRRVAAERDTTTLATLKAAGDG